MSLRFAKDWERDKGESLFSRIKEKIHPGPPLRERLSNSIYRLQVVLHKLQNTTARLEQKDKEYFERCMEAQMSKDQARATMYANECANIRKMAQTVLQSQLAIEQAVLRLETVRDFGDVAIQIAPVVQLVHSIKSHLMGIMPEVSMELGTIGDTLNTLVIEVGETSGAPYDVVATNENAQNILREAVTIAEHRMSEKFPEIPTSPSAAPEKSATPK